MQINTNIKKYAVVFGLFACGLAVIIFLSITLWSTKSRSPVPNSSNTSEKAETVIVKSSNPTDKLPLLPEDFPIDEKAQVTNNYSASPEHGDTIQYTRAYSSTKTLSVLNKTYTTYFEKNQWFIQSQDVTTNNAVISAVKDRLAVTVTIQQLQTSRFVVITVGQASTPFIIPNESENALPQ